MKNANGTCSIRYASHENIEDKLLVAISDDAKVACVFTCEDLTTLIHAIREVPGTRPTKLNAMFHDLIQFRRAAFGIPANQ
jgi:hypothetical protein